MHGSERCEDHKRITIGMTATEMIELDFIITAQKAEFVSVGFSGKKLFSFIRLKHVHLFHADFAILMGDELDRSGKGGVAANVIAVGMCIDDHGHWFIGDRLDLLQNARPIIRKFCIHHHHTFIRDKSCGVSTTTSDHEEVFLDLLNLKSSRLLLCNYQCERTNQ